MRRRRGVELSVQLGAVCTQRVGIGGGCVEVATEAVLAAARGGALLTQNFLVPQTRHLHLVLLLQLEKFDRAARRAGLLGVGGDGERVARVR